MICSCVEDPAGKVLSHEISVDRFVGMWVDEQDGDEFVEEWSINDSVGLAGKGYLLSKKDTIFIERLSIEKVDSTWVYYANANRKSQNSKIPFKLVVGDANKFVFENTQHDFPQRFIYQFKNDSLLELLIEGEENGNFRRRKISYKKRL
jgi:hypothetical protein